MLGQKLTSKYQTTIPKEIREFLGLEAGDEVIFVRKGDHVVIKRLTKTILDFQGAVKTPEGLSKDYDEVRRVSRQKSLAKRASKA